MARGLADTERFFRRIEALALSALPVRELTAAGKPDEHHDGVMVALVPDEPESLAVDSDGALDADDLHVTLCYLGEVQNLSSFDKTKILAETRRVCDAVGRTFSTNADGVIVMGQNDDGVPATALLVQSDDIVELYDALSEALNYRSSYPSFIPHMTAGYGVPVEEAEKKVGQQIDFSRVIVKFGDDTHTIPLASPIVAAPRSVNVIDRVIDSLGRLWDEALHPRDDEGKFIKKNGAVSGKLAVPTADRKGVKMVDANRASVVGFHTFDEDVWVLAEITNPDGSKMQGFARATSVKAVAPVKARLDALYPIDDRGDSFINSSLERKRQLDLILAHIHAEYGSNNDADGSAAFLDTLGLWSKDLDYLRGGDDPDHLGGLRKIDHELDDDELDELDDIIEDARTVKELRNRVHGIREDADFGFVVDEAAAPSSEGEFDGPIVERGITLTLSDDAWAEIRRLLRPPTTVDEIGQENKIGPMLVEMAKRHEAGIGNNWTTRPGMAETATMMSRWENGLPVIFTAKIRKSDIETRPEMMRDMATDEGEVRLVPGSDVEIHDVKIKDGQRWASVWEGTPTNSEILEPHTPPTQQLLQGDAPEQDAIDALNSGADPLDLKTTNLLGAMQASDRFERLVPSGGTGVSPIEWMVDSSDSTGIEAKLAGIGTTTTDRAYFIKKSIIGAELGNTDIVNEVTASLIAENVAGAVGDDDGRLLRVPKSVFGDNPEWDGETPPESMDIDDMAKTHQSAHVVSQHAAYLVPSDWDTTDAATEETSLRNDIRGLDPAAQVDQTEAFYEDIGDIYGNSIAAMVLWDFALLNGDRNPGNAILAAPRDGSEGIAVPIDHGFSFDEPFVEGDSESTFEWFMQYQFTRAWLNYVRGALNIDGNVSEATLMRVIQDFTDTYGRMDVEQIIAAFREIPGVTDDQVAKVEANVAGALDRIRWMGDNMDTVLRKIMERSN